MTPQELEIYNTMQTMVIARDYYRDDCTDIFTLEEYMAIWVQVRAEAFRKTYQTWKRGNQKEKP